MTAIVDIAACQILDSRGNPTIEVEVVLEDGSIGRAAGADKPRRQAARTAQIVRNEAVTR